MNVNRMHRKAVESKYDGLCTVYEYKKVKDKTTKLTEEKEVAVLENQPCRVSFVSSRAATSQQNAVQQQQKIKLFIAPDIVIKAGSKIVVTQNGVTTAYSNSGVPAVYSSHQEIMLELFERWA